MAYTLGTPLLYPEYQANIPESNLAEPRFDVLTVRQELEMGTDDGRWGSLGAYKIAASFLIAHYDYIDRKNGIGQGAPILIPKGKEVEDVKVQYQAIAKTGGYNGSLDNSSYGQEYIRWRKQYFTGGFTAGNWS